MWRRNKEKNRSSKGGIHQNEECNDQSKALNISQTEIYQILCQLWSTLLFGVETWAEVLRLADTERSLIQTVKQRKLSFFGHIIRHNSLQRNLLEDMVEGKRGRGRRPTMCRLELREVQEDGAKQEKMELRDRQS